MEPQKMETNDLQNKPVTTVGERDILSNISVQTTSAIETVTRGIRGLHVNGRQQGTLITVSFY